MQYNITYREKDKGIQFIISYKDDSGKWKQKSKQGFKTKRDAKKAATETLDSLKTQLKNNINLNSEYSEITFQDFKTLFLNHKKLYVTASTFNNFNVTFDNFKNLNNMKMIDIRNLHIQTGIDFMVKKENAPITIKTRVAYLRSFFNSALNEYKILSENPVVNIKLPTDKTKKEFKILNDIEFNTLVSSLESTRYYLIVLIAGTCGLRIGEILGLTWDCIDFNNAKMKINKQWKLIDGDKMNFGELKSKNSNRVIPIPPKTVQALKKYYNNIPLNIDGRLFDFGNNRSFQKTLNIRIHSLGYDISIHDLRHYYATKLISNGVDFKTAAKLLGHDVEMTMKTYSHVNDDMMQKTTNLISNIF